MDFSRAACTGTRRPSATASTAKSLVKSVIRFQSAYYVVTGIWPLISMRTFEAVTGPKYDKWLVKMVGLLAASIGATLAIGTQQDEISVETRMLAVTSALSFAAVDVIYSLRGRIGKIYLSDALLEALLLARLFRT
jgi:hypothetical protein